MRERARFWFVVFITLVLWSIEAASVLSILPFLQLISSPGLVRTNLVYHLICTEFAVESERQFMIWVGFVVFVVTVLGLVMKMSTMWITTRQALMRSYTFSSRLLRAVRVIPNIFTPVLLILAFWLLQPVIAIGSAVAAVTTYGAVVLLLREFMQKLGEI